MTAPDPTSLLSQAEAAIAVRRENEGQWWISDGQVRGGGEKILGPFASRDLALNVRRLYEAHSDAHGLTFWVSPDGLLDPAVFAAATDHAEGVLGRHRPDPKPIELMLHMDEECPTGECEEGDGHLSIVCRGCYPAWDGMQAHAVWPCLDARDALTALGIVVE